MLLLAMIVPGLHTIAGPVLNVPGGMIARLIVPQSLTGVSLYGGIAFFIIMIAVDVAFYYFVFDFFGRFSSSSRQTEDE